MINSKKFLFPVLFALSSVVMADSDASTSACNSSCSSECSVDSKNLWQPHAFSAYATREMLMMWGVDTTITNENNWVHRFGMATEYMQNFGGSCASLGAMPFWSGTNTMTIGNNDGKANLDAFQFGMGNVDVNDAGIGGSITLSPKVQHVGTELLWWGLKSEDKPGVYFKVKLPVGAMKISSNLCEDKATLTNANITNYPYYALRNETLTNAFQGSVKQQSGLFTGNTELYNGYFPALKYGLIACCTNQAAIRVGDLGAVLGANFIVKDNGHFGVGFKVSMPTGNVPTARYMLEPIFGRAGHWGVGGEVTAHYCYEINDSCSRNVSFWFQGEVMHLFSGRKPSWRSFDLAANGKGSKYMLLQHYVLSPVYFSGAATSTMTAGEIIPAINLTTLPVNSVFAVEGNFATGINYNDSNWNVGVIGEVWGRTQEKLSIDTCRALQYRDNQTLDQNLNNYVVVGRQVAAYGATAASSYCEPKATINQSQDYFNGQGTAPEGVVTATDTANHISSDYSVALDVCGAAAAEAITGKITGNIGYTWKDNDKVPQVSIFGGAEFPAHRKDAPRLWSAGIQFSCQY